MDAIRKYSARIMNGKSSTGRDVINHLRVFIV